MLQSNFINMNRRDFTKKLLATTMATAVINRSFPAMAHHGDIKDMTLSDSEWKQRLDPEEYRVLRKEGTEPAGTSPLNNEKRNGVFVCAGCGLELFTSYMKFDSGGVMPS